MRQEVISTSGGGKAYIVGYTSPFGWNLVFVGPRNIEWFMLYIYHTSHP